MMLSGNWETLQVSLGADYNLLLGRLSVYPIAFNKSGEDERPNSMRYNDSLTNLSCSVMICKPSALVSA